MKLLRRSATARAPFYTWTFISCSLAERSFLLSPICVQPEVPPFKGVLLTQEASLSHPTGWRVRLDADRNVTGAGSNAMPPDPRNAGAARLQIPFAELFDIAIPFLSEQTRSHTSSQLLHLSGIPPTIPFPWSRSTNAGLLNPAQRNRDSTNAGSCRSPRSQSRSQTVAAAWRKR